MQPTTICLTRRALLAQYSNSARDYAYLVRQLSERVAHPNHLEYLKLQRETEDARIQTEVVRLELEKHVTEHDCFPPKV